jgi:circadian clock protein KaiB
MEEQENINIEFETVLAKAGEEVYILRLYVTGLTAQSSKAIENIKKICEKNLKGRYNLEIINLYENPGAAKEEQIVAAPTLVKQLPLPLRRIIGNLSDLEKVTVSLDIKNHAG